MITDFSTKETVATAEAFSPWTGAPRTASKVIRKTAIAANKAIINRSPEMATGSSIAAQKDS
jgi:hypothetical protein